MVTVVPSYGPDPVLRYNGFPAADLIGDSDPRLLSSAEVLTKLQEIAQRTLPRGIELAWTDLSYQQVEQSNAAAVVFVIAVMLVFLVLAALYELDPAAGRDPDRARVHLRGAVRRVAGRRRQQRLRAGGPGGADGPGLQERDPDRGVRTRAGDARLAIVDAALQACRLRLRPIVMTSIAFIAGAVPLLIGGGAGSEVRAATGVTVFSGMLGVTLFGLFLTPVFYVTLRRLSGRSLATRTPACRACPPPSDTASLEGHHVANPAPACAGAGGCRLLAGCAVGPDFRTPEAPQAGAVRAGRACTGHPQAEPDAAFWRQFQDAQLTQLVEQALRATRTCGGAGAAGRRPGPAARKPLDQFPTLTLSGQARSKAQRKPGHLRAAQPAQLQRRRPAGSWTCSAACGATSRPARRPARRRGRSGCRWPLRPRSRPATPTCAAGSSAWHLAEANAANQQDTLRLVQLRLAHGSGTEFDLARAQAQLETTRSRIPALQARIAMAQHRLAVLTGQVPEALIAALDAPALPQLPPAIAPARPPACCAVAPMWPPPRRGCMRPRRGSAWPRPSCSRACRWAVCWAAARRRAVRGRQRQPQRVPGRGLVFPRRGPRARAHRCQRGRRPALAQYQQTVLLALEDTENALVLAAHPHRGRPSGPGRRAACTRRAAAQRRYRLGSVGLYEVLDAQRDLYAAQDAAADSRARGLRAAVALYQALAGGWDGKLPPA
jgi:outer membrane protein TolC